MEASLHRSRSGSRLQHDRGGLRLAHGDDREEPLAVRRRRRTGCFPRWRAGAGSAFRKSGRGGSGLEAAFGEARSGRQRACGPGRGRRARSRRCARPARSPPPVETCHFLVDAGKVRTKTSERPDSSETKARKRPSGENADPHSSAGVCAIGKGAAPPFSRQDPDVPGLSGLALRVAQEAPVGRPAVRELPDAVHEKRRGLCAPIRSLGGTGRTLPWRPTRRRTDFSSGEKRPADWFPVPSVTRVDVPVARVEDERALTCRARGR